MDENEDPVIKLHHEKYGPPSQNHWKPASMQPGSDKLPLFWIAHFALFAGLAIYFGYRAGG